MPARTQAPAKGRSRFVMGTNNVECDRTGFKVKASECKFEWNGLFVRKQSFEERHPQDLLRGFPDRQQPAVSRPGNGDVFIGPGDVTADDL